MALGGNKSFGSRVDGVVWNGDMVGPSRNKKPAGEAHPNNLIFSGWLLRGLCADLCVFARNSFFAIWPRTELVPKNNTLSRSSIEPSRLLLGLLVAAVCNPGQLADNPNRRIP